MSAAKKRGLGRGLDALLGLDTQAGNGGADGGTENGELKTLPVGLIQPGRYQPRTGMDPERLAELADSIKAQGLIQPIVVRAIGGGRYEIIAGERRWRAAQLAGMTDVPTVLREVDDHATLAMALIENIQREDLSPLEEANALKRLIEEFHLTHQQAAEAVGRSRAAVSNLLRLLELPAPIKAQLEQHRLEMGHARALLTLPEGRAVELAGQAAEANWSVRELEERVRAEQAPSISSPRPASRGSSGGSAKKAGSVDPNVASLAQNLSEKIGAKVSIESRDGGRGRLVIEYFSLDELDGILERIR